VREIGGAPGWSVTDPGSSFGPTVVLEVTPIKHWLELEIGVTQSFGRHSTAWSTDLLFKKPWDLRPKVEFMAGIGPEWIRTRSYGIATHSLAGEAQQTLKSVACIHRALSPRWELPRRGGECNDPRLGAWMSLISRLRNRFANGWSST